VSMTGNAGWLPENGRMKRLLDYREQENNKKRTHIFDIEMLVITIENSLDREMPYYQSALLAQDLFRDIIPWLTLDYMVSTKNARDRLQQNGVSYQRSHQIAEMIVTRLSRTFQMAYGSEWMSIVGQCSVRVRRQTDLILERE
jgi:hypothetical protein